MSAVVVSSQIQAVQVYRRGATIVRRAIIDGDALGSGLPDEIELAGLPLSLLDPTVKVRVLEVEPSSSSVTAAGVRVGLFVRGGGERPVAPEQKVVDELTRRLRDKQELVRLIDNEVGLLQGIPVPERPSAEDGRAPPPAPLQMRLALEGFADDGALKRRAERRALTTEMRELEEELHRQRERIAAASSSAEVHLAELSKSAIIALRGDGERPTKVTIEVSYVVPGARWTPAYQVKLERDGSKATIQSRAHIAQRTGEDWSGVKLRLSTALPLRFTELPELSSIRIGKAQPAPAKKGFRPPPAGGEVLFHDYDNDRARVQAAVPPPRPWHMPALEAPLQDLVEPAVAMSALSAPPRPAAKQAKRELERADRSLQTRMAVDSVGDEFDDDSLMDDSEMESVASPRPPPAPPAMSAPQRSARAPAPMAFAGGAPPPAKGRALARPGGPDGVDDVVTAMIFPLLRLPSGAEAQRGRLVSVDLRSLYAQSLARFGRPVPFDVLSAVQSAERDAMTAGTAPPPMTIDINDLSSFYDFVYEADGVVDVAGDGGYHSVALGEREGAASVRYVAVPREELAVYRTAVIQNPLAAPLLSGPAEVYVGGDYVLTTALPTVSLRGELKLGLGVEQAIKIARNARFSETRTGEGVVAMVELGHDVDIDIVNHLGRAIEIEVRERVPVPVAGAEVQVDERDVSPAWENYTQEERDAVIVGGRRWMLQVGAGASQKLTARYVLKLFSNSEVAGGNRRER